MVPNLIVAWSTAFNYKVLAVLDCTPRDVFTFYRIYKPTSAYAHIRYGQHTPKMRYKYECDSNLLEENNIYEVICFPNPSESK